MSLLIKGLNLPPEGECTVVTIYSDGTVWMFNDPVIFESEQIDDGKTDTKDCEVL